MDLRGMGAAIGLACALAALPEARAADLAGFGIEPYVAPPRQDYITPLQELRLGVFSHNWIHDEGAPVDVSIEVLSSPVRLWDTTNSWIAWFFHPRLNLGGMINTGGGTSYGYAGMTWRIPIYGRFFFEGEFGGAVNNGPMRAEWNRVDMGCRFTFRESGGFGYQVTDNIAVIASVEHVSHATFCTNVNPGLTQIGARVGYKF